MEKKKLKIGIVIGGILLCLFISLGVYSVNDGNGNFIKGITGSSNQDEIQNEEVNSSIKENPADTNGSTTPTSIGEEIKDIILKNNTILNTTQEQK